MNQKIEITLSQTEGLECTCGSFTFNQVFMLRRVSRILTGAAEDGIFHVPVFECTKCRTICETALTPDVKELFEDKGSTLPYEDVAPIAKIIQMPII